MSTNESENKHSTPQQKVIVWIVIILLMLLSFGLGYLLRGQSDVAPIIIETGSK